MPGSRVVIDGLSLAPTLNGQIAKVVCFDDSRGRYTVRLANSSEVKRVRPENLNQASDGVEGDGDDDAQSVDSMKLKASGASAAVSSSSSSDDGLGRTPQKRSVSVCLKRKRQSLRCHGGCSSRCRMMWCGKRRGAFPRNKT